MPPPNIHQVVGKSLQPPPTSAALPWGGQMSFHLNWIFFSLLLHPHPCTVLCGHGMRTGMKLQRQTPRVPPLGC